MIDEESMYYVRKHFTRETVVTFVGLGNDSYLVLVPSLDGKFRVVRNLSWMFSYAVGCPRFEKNGRWFVKIERHAIFKKLREFCREVFDDNHLVQYEII